MRLKWVSLGVGQAVISLVRVPRLGSGWPIFGIAAFVGLWVGHFGAQAVSSVLLARISQVVGFFSRVFVLWAVAALSISVYWSFGGCPVA